IHGNGTWNSQKGDRYQGQWHTSQKHGLGAYDLHDGQGYRGHYVDGEREGFGIFKWSGGVSYKGFWVAGRPAAVAAGTLVQEPKDEALKVESSVQLRNTLLKNSLAKVAPNSPDQDGIWQYLIEVWKATGMDMSKVKFLWSSEEISSRAEEYWGQALDIACRTTLARARAPKGCKMKLGCDARCHLRILRSGAI
ncbi:unnamed protein product, partial [Effrenium voratum]